MISLTPTTLPIGLLAVAPQCAQPNTLRVAAASISLQEECPVEILDVRVDAGTREVTLTAPPEHTLTPATSFPCASLTFAPPSTYLANDTLLMAGEALILSQMGRVVAYCSPAALNLGANSATPLLGDPADHPWTITRADWSAYNPENILACHRDGPICLYSVERLPGAATKMMVKPPTDPSGSSASKLLSRLTSSLLPRAPLASILEPRKSLSKGACEVISTIHSENTPYHNDRPRDCERFFTDARFLSSGKVIVASQSGSDQVVLHDLRVSGTRKTPAWEPSGLTPCKLLIEQDIHPHAVCGLDKQHSALVLYDLRMSKNIAGNITVMSPATVFTSSDLTGSPCILNDAFWAAEQGNPSAAERLHVACQPHYEDARNVPAVISIDVHSFSSKVLETQAWTPMDPDLAGVAVVSQNNIGVFASTRMKRGFTQELPQPPSGDSIFANEILVEGAEWSIGVVSQPRHNY